MHDARFAQRVQAKVESRRQILAQGFDGNVIRWNAGFWLQAPVCAEPEIAVPERDLLRLGNDGIATDQQWRPDRRLLRENRQRVEHRVQETSLALKTHVYIEPY